MSTVEHGVSADRDRSSAPEPPTCPRIARLRGDRLLINPFPADPWSRGGRVQSPRLQLHARRLRVARTTRARHAPIAQFAWPT